MTVIVGMNIEHLHPYVVPVGVIVAKQLNLPFDVSVVSKITLPWNTEAGYEAVAFADSLPVNDEDHARHLNLPLYGPRKDGHQ
ncbi:MAG: hypothetical protein JRJ47_14195 [Deltaproteobacteria bacterium]|nr:hypothetical protein [Deltaproteobacteria bacterium]